MSEPTSNIYGILAEFDHPEQLLAAARKTLEAGYRKFDAFTPFPIEGLSAAVGFTKTRVPLLVLAGGIMGAMAAMAMMCYSAIWDYPLNVGGRPLFSWPAFIPITFELTVLGAATSAVLGMLALNGLPMPYHPLFNSNRFAMASHDRFFLCIEAQDPAFNLERTRKFMEDMGHCTVEIVPA